MTWNRTVFAIYVTEGELVLESLTHVGEYAFLTVLGQRCDRLSYCCHGVRR